MQLHTLLQKIKSNQPVNFDQVVKFMPTYIDWNSIFRVSLSGKNKHSVNIINDALFDILLKQSLQPQTRAHAASLTISSSHDHKCDSAYMLCFPVANNSHADVSSTTTRTLTAMAVSQKVLLPLPFKPAKQAILIENQDCFFQWPAFMAHYRDLVNLPQSDIFFAGGSRILNDAFHPILTQYIHIKCLFDYDLAGLKMAYLLRQKKDYQDVEYVVPTNLSIYAALFTFLPPSAASLSAMLSLCDKYQMHSLRNVIQVRKRFMEQEAMLTIQPGN
ncbi:MAG: hypothetical protein ACI8ZZ_000816 [Gammaproteobacteria bacterium]|jgi:hypothetical protein